MTQVDTISIPAEEWKKDTTLSLTYREVLRSVILQGSHTLYIPTEDVPKVRKALRNLKGKLNMKLRKLGVEPIDRVLVFFNSPYQSMQGYCSLLITLQTRGCLPLTAEQLGAIKPEAFLD